MRCVRRGRRSTPPSASGPASGPKAYATKLKTTWALEIAPRAGVTPVSVYLLLDDEMHTKEPGVIAAFVRQYMFHVTAVSKG